jgi:hypothetical protein
MRKLFLILLMDRCDYVYLKPTIIDKIVCVGNHQQVSKNSNCIEIGLY